MIDREFHISCQTKISLFAKTDLSGYTISTLLIDDPNLLPFYQTMIFDNSPFVFINSTLNGRSFTCTLKKNAHSMHANAVAMANLAITMEDESQRIRELIRSFSKHMIFYG